MFFHIIVLFIILLVLPYKWVWGACFLFGAILSVIDPLTSENILEDVGVSRRLISIIEGQSLLNDGSCVAFVEIFLRLIEGGTENFGDYLLLFIRLFFGGLLLGAVVGFLAVILVPTFHDESIYYIIFSC